MHINNPANAEVANTEMDGFTVTLTLKAPVNPGVNNTIKIAIADGGDRIYDSNLLIAGNSVQTALIAEDDEVEVTGTQSVTLDVLANDSSAAGGTLTITHINGIPVVAGDTVTLSTGETILLNPDGTFTVTGDGDEDENVFTYTVEDEDGNTDTAFVEVKSVACFVAGTMIDTPKGAVRIEDLTPGTLVLTRDHGPQPLRWIGRTRVQAQGALAPVRFAAGALGAHGQIDLSPNHRVLVEGARAELLFGQSEVLVKAAHLINDSSIRRRADGGAVDYVHLLFDTHEIVCANGMESESYHPGVETMDAFDAETRAEILTLMPQLADAANGDGYGPSARVTLKAHEGVLLARYVG